MDKVEFVILDLTPVPHIDSMGCHFLEELNEVRLQQQMCCMQSRTLLAFMNRSDVLSCNLVVLYCVAAPGEDGGCCHICHICCHFVLESGRTAGCSAPCSCILRISPCAHIVCQWTCGFAVANVCAKMWVAFRHCEVSFAPVAVPLLMHVFACHPAAVCRQHP